MRRIPLALLSAALLLLAPLAGMPSRARLARQASRRPAPAAGRPPLGDLARAAAISPRRVAEQDHDYETGADQIDLALGQAPDDPELLYAAFRLRIYAGRDRAGRAARAASPGGQAGRRARQPRAGGPADQEGRLPRRRAAARPHRRREPARPVARVSCSPG